MEGEIGAISSHFGRKLEMEGLVVYRADSRSIRRRRRADSENVARAIPSQGELSLH